MKKLSVALFAVIILMLVVASFALAAPAEAKSAKVPVCHADENGDLHLINVSIKAVKAHEGHGDPVIDVDVDENCEPIDVGCRVGDFEAEFYIETYEAGIQC